MNHPSFGNSPEDYLRVAINQNNKSEGDWIMCITKSGLDRRVKAIKEYKSIKKDADKNLKPLEADVKIFMNETGQTEFIGYGYSISYKEQEREDVVKEKVLEFLSNPKIKQVIEDEKIDTSVLFKTTIIRPLRIN